MFPMEGQGGQMIRNARRVVTGALLALVGTACLAAQAEAHTAHPHVPYVVEHRDCPYWSERGIATGGCFYADFFGTGPRIFVSPHESDETTLAHELGHLYDETDMQPESRDRFREIFKLRREWWEQAAEYPDGPPPPAELFAEGYARCSHHKAPWRTGATAYGYDPTPAQHKAVCRLIWENDRVRRTAGQQRAATVNTTIGG